jgi:hypothetical protein
MAWIGIVFARSLMDKAPRMQVDGAKPMKGFSEIWLGNSDRNCEALDQVQISEGVAVQLRAKGIYGVGRHGTTEAIPLRSLNADDCCTRSVWFQGSRAHRRDCAIVADIAKFGDFRPDLADGHHCFRISESRQLSLRDTGFWTSSSSPHQCTILLIECHVSFLHD